MKLRRSRWACLALCAMAAWGKPGLARAAAHAIQKGPYLTGLSESGADVRFELDEAAPASVEVRRDDGAARTFREPTSLKVHAIHANGLEPGVRYAYVVRAANCPAIGGHFTTAPRPDSTAPLRFLVYGDDRTDPAAHQAVVQALSSIDSDFLVNTGDLVQDGASAPDWQSFFDIESALLRDRPIFVAIGNHELYSDSAGANFARYFGFPSGGGDGGAPLAARPYGSVRVGEIRFFFMNGMDDWSSGEERHWLEEELSRADAEAGLVWRIGVVHQGPWSSGPHGPNPRMVAAQVPELLAAHKVDLLLSGHDHIYERGAAGGTKYLISGGGGAPLYPIGPPGPATRKAESAYHFIEATVTPEAMRFVARRADGSVLDRCAFAKGGPWDCDQAAASAPVVTPNAPAQESRAPSRGSSRCNCELPGGGPQGQGGAWRLAALALAVAAAFSRVWVRRRGARG